MTDREFFREVEEAVRQDRYRRLFDRYGVYIIAAAVLIIAGVAGYKAWTYWRESEAKDAGSKFSQAVTLSTGGESAEARKTFERLAAEGPKGYAALSRFQLAASEAKAGERDKAVATYDALATDSRVDNILQGYAALQAAALRLETADYAEMERRLDGLLNNSPWRYSARELLGLSAYRLNNMGEAEKQFSALVGDQGTPSNLRQRADMMLALIAGDPKSLSTTAN
jgi:hypothetical protein